MPATLPWSGVAGAFDSPSVDVLYPPEYDTRLILLIAFPILALWLPSKM